MFLLYAHFLYFCFYPANSICDFRKIWQLKCAIIVTKWPTCHYISYQNTLVMHCYPGVYLYNILFQILYNSRRTTSLGLSDGECVERLWSFWGKFCNISKEMTPENRIDLLLDGLIHYGEKVMRKQGIQIFLHCSILCLQNKIAKYMLKYSTFVRQLSSTIFLCLLWFM